MSKLSSPFSENIKVTYTSIGTKAPKRKYERKKEHTKIDNMRSGSSTTNQEEIELCLTCPYPKCVAYCDRIKKLKKRRTEERSQNTKIKAGEANE